MCGDGSICWLTFVSARFLFRELFPRLWVWLFRLFRPLCALTPLLDPSSREHKCTQQRPIRVTFDIFDFWEQNVLTPPRTNIAIRARCSTQICTGDNICLIFALFCKQKREDTSICQEIIRFWIFFAIVFFSFSIWSDHASTRIGNSNSAKSPSS